MLFVLCLAGLFWAMVPARSAEASINNVPASQSTSFSPDSIGVIGATSVLTDQYENNDTAPGYNLGTNYNIGTPCTSPTQLASNASLYKDPGTDVDNYYFSVVGSAIYTLTVELQQGQTAPTTPINFIFQVFNNQTSVQVGAQTAERPSVSFFAPADGTYRMFISAQNPSFAPRDQSYRILLCSSSDRVVATTTPTLTPVPSATTAGAQPDGYEPNDSPDQVLARVPVVSYINIGQQVPGVNFFPQLDATGKPIKPITTNRDQGDVDWYFVYLRQYNGISSGTGGTYRIAVTVQPGVDTEFFMFRDANCSTPSGALEVDGAGNPRLFAYNDDSANLVRGSQVDFNSDKDCVYWIRLWNKDPSPRGAGQTYSISVVEFLSTPAPTSSPAPTSIATPYPQGIDSFEYNGDFDRASLIAPGVKYSNLNFVPFQPPSADTVDNDFFRIPVKQGIYYTCETLDLAAGVDTNMIVYNQDRVGVGGNDDTSLIDRTQGKFGSRVTWLAGYTGIAYVLIGEVSPPRPNEAAARTYALQCIIGIPSTPTPVGGPPTATPVPSPFVPPTPEPPDPTMTPFPTPRTAQNLAVRKIEGGIPGRGAAAPTVQPTATPRPVALDVQIFNDVNKNGLLDPGEGISGASIRISDESSATPLGQTTTDSEGRARFTIFNEGTVRVSVPMFGYSTLINEVQATVRIALVPSEQLPARIP